MSNVELEEKYNDMVRVIDMKRRHPTILTEHVVEMLKGILYNGDAAQTAIINEETPFTKNGIRKMHYREPVKSGDKFAGDVNTTGVEVSPETGRFVLKKDFNKKFELIGKEVGGMHLDGKFGNNPYGIKLNVFARCERKSCGLVGITGLTLQYKKEIGKEQTYIYKRILHEAGNGHYTQIARYNGILTWEQILAKEKRRMA